jgi:hypothetical protein
MHEAVPPDANQMPSVLSFAAPGSWPESDLDVIRVSWLGASGFVCSGVIGRALHSTPAWHGVRCPERVKEPSRRGRIT